MPWRNAEVGGSLTEDQERHSQTAGAALLKGKLRQMMQMISQVGKNISEFVIYRKQ